MDMVSQKIDKFLEITLSYIKYPFAKKDIKMELEEHILDKIDYYIETGYEREEAENQAIEDMGDPEEIGELLNKEHKPIIGWMIRITSVAIGLLIFLNVIFTGWVVLALAFDSNPIKRIPKEDIIYRMDISEKVQIDDRVIIFTNIVYDKNEKLHIIYKHYDKKFWRMGWSLGNIGEIKTDTDYEYLSGSGYEGSGFISRGRRTLNDFPKDAKTLIIEYDSYNRYYRVEIPLKSGEIYD